MIIYQIKNKINNKIYVGQTIQALSSRIADHKCKSKRKKWLGELHKDMNKFGFENFESKILEKCNSREELNIKEKYWIKKLNTIYPNGYNLESGGEIDVKIPIITRKRMSEGRKKSKKIKRCKVFKYNKKFKLIKIFDSMKECKIIDNVSLPSKNIFIKNKGYKSINGFYYLIKENNIEELKNKIEKEKMNDILQYDKNGNCIDIFKTTLEAEKITGINNVNISVILRKKRIKTSNGIFFLYRKNATQKEIEGRVNYILPKGIKKVHAYNKNENYIFDNAVIASKKMNINRQLIGRACKDKKLYKNYYWEFCE